MCVLAATKPTPNADNFSAVAGFRSDGFVVKNTTETNASGYDYVGVF